MSKFVELMYNTFIRKYSKAILVLFALIVILTVGYYSYKWYAVPKINKPAYNDVANANRREKTAEIFFFYADWCPHCKNAKPEWKTFCDKYNGKSVNGYIINCNDINCTDTSVASVQQAIETYNIEHYPTLKMIKDSVTIDFDSKITNNTLEQFVNTVTASS